LKFQVETPDLRPEEFDCAELVERVLTDVRRQATETGGKISARLTGEAPEAAQGNARHIHHLITLLSQALAGLAGVDEIELALSFEQRVGTDVQMLMSYAVAAGEKSETVALSLQRAAGANEPEARADETELSIRVAWQLALALGGVAEVKTLEDRKTGVVVSIPLTGAVNSARAV
jgi:hypothetical protein